MGIRIAEQTEQPRVLLLSVPYAMKAETRRRSADCLPQPSSCPRRRIPHLRALIPRINATEQPTHRRPRPTSPATGTAVNFHAALDHHHDHLDSVSFNRPGAPFKIGVNTRAPATTLDVKGAATIRGILNLPATGAATAAGANSQPLNLAASSSAAPPAPRSIRFSAGRPNPRATTPPHPRRH